MILIINPGSSSLKYKLFNKELEEIKSKSFSRIGEKIRSHEVATNLMMKDIQPEENQITKVAFRVVHGGDTVHEIEPITLPLLKIIENFSQFAPHHNPQSLKVIRKVLDKIPIAEHFVAFDNAFFNNLPDVAKIYPIDFRLSEELKIRRFGFHGISHQFMIDEVDPEKEKKVITIHLGAGCSISAINKGKPIDTSMGFTPMEGLAMQTRSGDLDPGLVLFLVERLGLRQSKELFENNSGLAGMTNSSGDMLSILKSAGEEISDSIDHQLEQINPELARISIEVFCQKVKKYIGAYAAELGGVDEVVFSGEIGYGSEVIRKKITSGISFLNFKTKIIKPDEELAIARKLPK